MFANTGPVFTVIVGLAASAKADFFANFFSDSNCKVNGGIGVDLRNPSCLGEKGRGSVYIPNTGLLTTPLNQWCLVITRNGQCNCQSSHLDFTATGFCAVLNPEDSSYRFIHGSCAANNC